MKKIVLDIQSDIHAHTMERMLMQKLDDCQVVISESPDATAEWCKTHRPDVLLMEVKAYSPWMFKERMAIRDKVKRNTESCRVILFVDDDTDEDLTEKVRQAKARGSDRRFSLRFGIRKLLCFGHRQCLNQATQKA